MDEPKVLEIRRKYSAGEADQYELAKEYGVGQSTIGRIVRGENWRHVEGKVTRRMKARGDVAYGQEPPVPLRKPDMFEAAV